MPMPQPEPDAPFDTAPLPVMPLMPPPYTPAEPESTNEFSDAYDLPDPVDHGEPAAEPDADELPVPLPVSNYRLPDPRVLARGTRPTGKDVDVERVGASLLAALTEHGVEARLIGTVSGPRVTRYELQLAPGTKVATVDGPARRPRLRARDDRDPHPGADPGQAGGRRRGAEPARPNARHARRHRRRLPAPARPLTVWLGKDISGQTVVADLAKMPHMLIAGTTGSGKSGCINAMLCSILLRATPDEVRMILIDPKKVELNHYEAIPHLLTPVVTNMKNAAAVLQNVVRRDGAPLRADGARRARNLPELNRALERAARSRCPYMLVVIDELADLMMVSPAEVEDAIIRLAQKSRAVGIHLVLATQRPSVDVITGMIKANVPSRIAFAVSSQTDSRVILDVGGAESLLGQGDMLFKPLGTSRLQRVQGAYVTEEEIALLVEQCRAQARAGVRRGAARGAGDHAGGRGGRRRRLRSRRGSAARRRDPAGRPARDGVGVAAPAPPARRLHARRPADRHARAPRRHLGLRGLQAAPRARHLRRGPAHGRSRPRRGVNGATWQSRTAVALLAGALGEGLCALLARLRLERLRGRDDPRGLGGRLALRAALRRGRGGLPAARHRLRPRGRGARPAHLRRARRDAAAGRRRLARRARARALRHAPWPHSAGAWSRLPPRVPLGAAGD